MFLVLYPPFPLILCVIAPLAHLGLAVASSRFKWPLMPPCTRSLPLYASPIDVTSRLLMSSFPAKMFRRSAPSPRSAPMARSAPAERSVLSECSVGSFIKKKCWAPRAPFLLHYPPPKGNPVLWIRNPRWHTELLHKLIFLSNKYNTFNCQQVQVQVIHWIQ